MAAVIILLYLTMVLVMYVLPILAIVFVVKLIRRHLHPEKTASPEPSVAASQAIAKQSAQVTSQFNDERKVLEQAIDEELDKDAPDVAKIKAWRAEIANLQQRSEADLQAIQTPLQPQVSANMISNQTVSASPAQAAEEKHSGLNALLYVGSFLIVTGAGSLIIAASASAAVKCLILFAIVAIFYVGGLAMRNNRNLLPAGTALVGTALAITPFLGFAFTGFAHMQWNVSWLCTSLLGVALYSIATFLLNNKVIAYFSLIFMMSLVCSVSACLEWEVIWYFVAMMCVSILLSVVSIFGKKLQLRVFETPVYFAGRWFPVIIALASVTIAPIAHDWQYALIYGLGSLQAIISWLATKDKTNLMIARGFVQVFLPIIAYVITGHNLFWVGIVIAITALAHAVWSLFIYEKTELKDKENERIITVVLLAIFLFSLAAIAVGESANLGLARLDITRALAIVYCLTLAVFCIGASRKQQETGWLYGVMAAVIALPIVVHIAYSAQMPIKAAYLYTVYYIIAFAGFLGWLQYRLPRDITKTKALSSLGSSALAALSIAFFVLGTTTQEMWLHFVLLFALAAAWYLAGEILDALPLRRASAYIVLILFCRIIDAICSSAGVASNIWAALTAHVVGISLCALGFFFNDRDQKDNETNYGQQLLGVLAISLTMGCLALSASGSAAMIWPIVFLLEEIALMVIGVSMKWKWMWVVGAVGSALAALWFTRSIAYVWFILIGIGLIALVIYKLTKGGTPKNP